MEPGLMSKRVKIKSGREKSIKHRHPWIFSGAIEQLPACIPGEIVDVFNANNQFLARGYCNEKSQIQIRLLSWSENEKIDHGFFEEKITSDFERKRHLFQHTNAIRVLNAESDGIPGLIIDRYSEVFVTQILTAGVDRVKDVIFDVLKSKLGAKIIVDRSDDAVREREGLQQRWSVVIVLTWLRFTSMDCALW